MQLRENLFFYRGIPATKITPGTGSCNTIVIGRDKLIMIDPGASIGKTFTSLTKRMTHDGLDLQNVHSLMFTHVHFDHSNSAAWVKDTTDCVIRTHPYDISSVENPIVEYKRMMLPIMNSEEFPKVRLGVAKFFTDIFIGKRYPAKVENALNDRELIHHEGLTIEIIFTPGHAPGHISYYIHEYKTLIAGDCIVRDDNYHTDCGGCINNMESSWNEIVNTMTLLNKLDVELYIPGHGDPIEGKEAVRNLFAKNLLITSEKPDHLLSLIPTNGASVSKLLPKMYPKLPFIMYQIKKIEILLLLQLLQHQNKVSVSPSRQWKRVGGQIETAVKSH